MTAGREQFARYALAQIPKILTLQDRNPHSPTYGCFDRNYWHYRMLDFPSGMSQEFVYPLALVSSLPLPDNPYYGSAAVHEWVRAGIHFAARSAHRDGSCDDYFPFERALGAAAFSLLACAGSARLLDIRDDRTVDFLARRADWLAAHDESGRLANHHALTVLALTITGRFLGVARWEQQAGQRLRRLLDWQHDEGWFPEYDGCDPGYHTLTIGCLAQLLAEGRDDLALREAVRRAVELVSELMHPDGTYGGEYGSRNTYNFFPHGFELAGTWHTAATSVNDLFLRGLSRGLGPSYEDDHLIGHHAWSYLLAWRHWQPQRGNAAPRRHGRLVLSGAGIAIERRGTAELYVGTRKGGVFKLFRNGAIVASDTGVSLRIESGSGDRTAVTHMEGAYEVQLDPDVIAVGGTAAWAREERMTPLKLVILRIGMLTVGRFFPNLVRRSLQRMLITGRREAPFRFRRTLRWSEDHTLHVTDEVHGRGWSRVLAAGIGGAQTSIYVVMSRVFQSAQLAGWQDVTTRVRELRPGEPLIIERRL